MSTRLSKGKTRNKNNRILPYLAVLLSVSSLTVPGTVGAAAGTGSANDLQQASPWARQAIEIVTEQQMFPGTQDGLFHPRGSLTRGDLAYTLVRIAGLNQDSEVQNSSEAFKDLNSGTDNIAFIKLISSAGIMKGYPDGTFRPDGLVTREQLAVTLMRLIHFRGFTEAGGTNSMLSFKDASSISPWAVESVKQAVRLGLLKGENGQFAPKRPTTRQEMAVIALRGSDVIKTLEESSELDDAASDSDSDKPDQVTEVEGTTTGNGVTGNSGGNTTNGSGNNSGSGSGNAGGGSGSTPTNPTNPTNPETPSNPEPENQVPVVINDGLPDQELILDHASLEFQASSYFSDPDGEVLQFSIIDGDEAVVSTAVDGQTIKLTAVAEGEAVLTVKAVDNQGASVTAQLKITVLANTISRQFPDPHLAGAIAYWLEKDVNDPLTKQELVEALVQTDGGLYARDAGISDLTGYEIFKGMNVTEIDLSGNNISLVNAEGFTQLKKLNLFSNQLTEVHVSGLSNLEELVLSYNQMTSLDVSGLSSLQMLDVGDNQLNHFPTGVADLPLLQNLNIRYNSIMLRDEPDLTLHMGLLERLPMYDFDDASPVLVEAPAGNMVYVGEEETEIDLGYMFEDEDDDRSTLILTAESPDPQIVEVRMDGQKLYVRALASSEIPIQIHVQARDVLGKMDTGYVEVMLKTREELL
ncbi:S-layer homology domain-containing protein [Paenibacillus illinoisensis]|uniref:S-layer homology domain-containing protein n=1 Tax=Paenibacillus illinoisensis TaxID=59845 RepID=UPI003D275B4F